MSERRVSRRAALGTAAGVGLATVVAAAPGAADAATPSFSVLTTTVAVASGGVRRRRTVGDTVAHVLPLVGAAGTSVGELVVSGTVLAVRGAATDTAAVHHHLLRLPGGTLAGHGTVDLAGGGEFVVVGGTGRFRGATGSYRLRTGSSSGSTLTWEA